MTTENIIDCFCHQTENYYFFMLFLSASFFTCSAPHLQSVWHNASIQSVLAIIKQDFDNSGKYLIYIYIDYFYTNYSTDLFLPIFSPLFSNLISHFKYFYCFAFIISFMQARQSFEAELGFQFIYPNLIDPQSIIKGPLSDCQILPKIQTATTIKDQANSKRKGRPKGQKNGPQRERKQKAVIDEGDRKRGHWSLEENKRYHWFLEIYNKHFICKQMRRLDKIFKTMALFIGSREAEQCRSHHQKMEKKFSSFLNIILFLRRSHYGSEDEKRVLEDMESNQIRQSISFINVQELRDLQAMKKVPATPSLIEQSKANMQVGSPIREVLFQQNMFDMLGENYEHMLNFNGDMF